MEQTADLLTTRVARELVTANAIRSAVLVAQPGGWAVRVRYGLTERTLAAQRVRRPRLWRTLDACVAYLYGELGIRTIEGIDGRDFDRIGEGAIKRPERAQALRQAHAAVEHDKWFREQVELAIAEADDPNTVWIPNEQVVAEMDAQRDRILEGLELAPAATAAAA